MKPNPGGQLAPDEVIGRDRLIAKLWSILERQSLVLTAERRMGKTSILKKMVAEPQPGVRIFFRDLEALRSPLEFVECVYQDVQADLSRRNRSLKQFRQVLEQLGGAEFMGAKLPQIVAPHWKLLLTAILEDLTADQGNLLVFGWDELPMMLDNIKRAQSEAVAMEVLDTLRSLRQMLPRVRMVFTGSIGLHHVLTQLKEVGYANSPTNDMGTEDVAPISLEDACDLATRLLQGAQVEVGNRAELARAIATAVDCFPYYIHHVVDALQWSAAAKTPEQVNEIVQANLCDDVNRWDLAHYRGRIDTYYREDKTLALAILDELAAAENPLGQQQLLNRLNVQGTEQDPERVRQVLTLLGRDHYLARRSEGTYGFRFGLIQRYWQLSRGL